jgi:serine/threonine protein kinase
VINFIFYGISLTGLRPFFSQSEAVAGEIQWFEEDWEMYSPHAKELVEQLLNVDVSKRLSATEALKHPWFNV